MKTSSGFKQGRQVSVTRGGVACGRGRVHSTEQRINGEWFGVNFAEPRKPAQVRYYRASNLRLV